MSRTIHNCRICDSECFAELNCGFCGYDFETETVPSPCINKCQRFGNICMGCYRSMEEIANWQTMTNEQKRDYYLKIKEAKTKIWN